MFIVAAQGLRTYNFRHGQLAQWLERSVHIRKVVGSNPMLPTNLRRRLPAVARTKAGLALTSSKSTSQNYHLLPLVYGIRATVSAMAVIILILRVQHRQIPT